MFSQKLKIICAFAAIYLVWGSTFLFVKIALHSFSPFVLSTLRFFIGGSAVMAFAFLQKNQFPQSSELIKQAILGCVIFLGGIMAVVWAQQHLSSSLASTIITTPFWFIILDKKQWSYYFSNRNIIIGLLLGLVGVTLLMFFKQGVASNSSASMQLISILIMMGGSFLWVSGSLYLKYNPSPSSVYANTSVQLISAGIFSTLISFFNGEIAHFEINQTRLVDWAAVVYLAIFSTTLTFLAYMWLIKIKPPAIVSTYSYVNPMVATLLGWSFGNEHISTIQMLALGIILSGVLFVNLGKNKV
jgi:drug/metabolite transporter (DMT)-like permease